jgi:CRP/FNR family transcriptional regulator
MSELAHLLNQSGLFKSLDQENRNRLAEICLPKSIKKREIIFLEGDKGAAIYLCAKGSIQLYKTGPDGQEVSIKVVRSGDLFAEVILFEKTRYPVSAVALEESRVYLIPKHQFDCLLQEITFRNDFMANLMGKLRYLTEQVQVLSVHDVEDRLFRFLKDQYGDRTEFHVNISKKDVASAIGATPETLSRLLLRLKEENKLIWDGKRLQLLHKS